MSANEFEAAQIDAAIRDGEREFDSARTETYRAFIESQAARAEQLAQEADHLEATVGSEDPGVVRRRTFAALANDLAGELIQAAEREARVPEVGPDENLLYGRVLDDHGQPLPGLIVRVVPTEGGSDSFLGGGTTDDAGGFAIVYPRGEIRQALAAGVELRVELQDGGGKHLYTSNDPVTFEGTQAEYFEFSIPTVRGRPGDGPAVGRAPTGGATATPRTASTTGGRSTTGPAGGRVASKAAAPKPRKPRTGKG